MQPRGRNVSQAYGVHPATIDGTCLPTLTRYDVGMKWLVLAVVLGGCSTDTFAVPDGSTADGGGSDASSEASGSDATCATGSTCPSGAQCNSFDDLQETLSPFLNISQNGGTVTFEGDVVVTCPHALAAFSPPASGSGSPTRGAIGGTAALNVPNAIAHARIELDVIFPKVPSGSVSFLFVYPNTDATNGIGVVWSGGSWFVHDAVTNDDAPVSPRTDTWNHVALDVTFSESNQTNNVQFFYTDTNGQPQVAKLSKSTLASAALVSNITFGVGVMPIGTTSGPMLMHLDDVVFSL
jgi:hypothetical protein